VANQSKNVTGGDVATKGVAPSDSPTDAQYRSEAGEATGGAKYRYESGSDAPAVLRRPDGFVTQDEADRLLDACQAAARRARDAFKEACEAPGPDDAEASFLAAKLKLEELWNFAYLRDRAFRDPSLCSGLPSRMPNYRPSRVCSGTYSVRRLPTCRGSFSTMP
jgi:hypothetical protein